MTGNNPDRRKRDRDATAAAILAAAEQILAEEGFAAFGVNAVARRAGCDKQLIYRYFGGLDGLLDAIGEDLGAELAEDLAGRLAGARPGSYGQLMADVAAELVDLFRHHPVLRGISAWESAAPSPAVQRMGAARARQLGAWVEALRGPLRPAPEADFGALNAALFAAAQQLALSGCATASFAGMPLEREADWDRAKAALRRMALAVYQTGEAASVAGAEGVPGAA